MNITPVIQIDLSSYKSRELISLICSFCGKTFFKSKHYILNNIRRCGSVHKFCSLKCKGKSKTKLNTKNVKCSHCNKNFKKTNKEIRDLNFCNHRCHAYYLNSHKNFGSNRSKLEKWIEEQLILKYPNLEIHYNRIDTINAELDIYIPSLKLAFELNGIFHYEPIFGKDRLNKTKSNDQRKFQACLDRSISLCIIDTFSSKYLKKERDKKFLDIIIHHIETIRYDGIEPSL